MGSSQLEVLPQLLARDYDLLVVCWRHAAAVACSGLWWDRCKSDASCKVYGSALHSTSSRKSIYYL
jgi:hypothetical protein